jgi:hypothetical protein
MPLLLLMIKKTKKEGTGDMSEEYFRWWLLELEEVGLVSDIRHQPSKIIITEAITLYFSHKYSSNKSDIIKSRTLFQPITYTPDFSFLIHKNLLNKLFCYVIKKDNTNYIQDDPNLVSGNVFENTIWYTTAQIDDNWFEVIVDIKPPAANTRFGTTSAPNIFSNKQKIIFEKYFLYINKVVPADKNEGLFTKTFTPKRYLFTDVSKVPRKIAFRVRTRNEYLTSKNIEPA